MSKKKVGFTSSIGFILAAAGSAIGLGNLWGFPYKTSKYGGAAFVIVYIVCVILIGLVTMLSEMFIGKRYHANPITCYKSVNKNYGWCGVVAVAIPTLITCYYSVLGGWTVKYAVASFEGNESIISSFSVDSTQLVLFIAIFIGISVAIIMFGVEKGIENMSKILMPILFIIIVGIAIYSCTLGTGVAEGLNFYLNPDFSKLTVEGILTAMGQAFYSLSLGMGIMVTYGSYVGSEINISRSCIVVCIFDTVIALLAGFAIFPAVSHFDQSLLNGSKGIALMYIILPKVFASMGAIGKLVSFAFFSMVTIAAITSVISLIEVTTQFVIQKFKVNRKLSALVVATVCFGVAIPIAISLGHAGILEDGTHQIFGLDALTFLDEVTNTVLMPVCALFACFAVGWIYKPEKALVYLEEHGSKVPKFLAAIFPVMIKFITPALILIVEISGLVSEIKNGNYPVIIAAYGLVIVCALIYFLFMRNSYTGTNKDEVIKE